jgi:hypothetical protein
MIVHARLVWCICSSKVAVFTDFCYGEFGGVVYKNYGDMKFQIIILSVPPISGLAVMILASPQAFPAKKFFTLCW